MNQPNYRLKVIVYDEETVEEVASMNDPLYSFEDNIATLQRAFRNFDKSKQDFEATYYPKEDVEV